MGHSRRAFTSYLYKIIKNKLQINDKYQIYLYLFISTHMLSMYLMIL